MASSAYISASGRILTLLIDADTGTFTQELTVDIDPATAITLTASGGSVAPYQVGTEGTTARMNGVVEPDKYPFGDLTSNQAKIRIELDRQIHFGETVTISILAGFITDGSTDSLGSIDMSVTNNSLWHDEVGELISDSAKIVYVDPTLGNDTNAAAVNSSSGYYTKLDSEVGDTPSTPDGSIVAYATLGAALSVFSGDDTGCILLKRGETFDGDTHYLDANRMLGGTLGGSSSTAPLVAAGYGTGTGAAVMNPGSTNGRRCVDWTGTRQHYVYGRGLEINLGSGSEAVRLLSTSTAGDYGHGLFVGCHIYRVKGIVSTQGDQSFLRSDIAFCNCHFDNTNDDQGMSSSDDFNDFTFREFEFYRTSFSNIGRTNGLDHPLYAKAHGDLVIQECLFYSSNGAPIKCDNCWGLEFSRNLITDCWSVGNVESNGDPAAGVAANRDEDTETNEYPVIANADGAYSKWITVRNNCITDFSSAATSASIISRYGQAYYSSVHDNIMVSDRDVITNGVVFVESGGSADGGYTRDSYDCKFYNNTVVCDATSTTQQYGARLRCATTDTFNTTNNNSKGHHDHQIDDNVFWFGNGLTGTVRALDVVSDTYADALAAGRMDGTVDGNILYKEGGSETDFYRDESTDYSTIASWEAVVSGGDNNSFADPSFSEVGYQISDYANDLDSLTLANFMEAVIDDYRDETLTEGYQIQEIIASILSRHQASTSGKGAQDWASVETGEKVRSASRVLRIMDLTSRKRRR